MPDYRPLDYGVADMSSGPNHTEIYSEVEPEITRQMVGMKKDSL